MVKAILRDTACIVSLLSLVSPHLLNTSVPAGSSNGIDYEVRYVDESAERDLVFGKWREFDTMSMRDADVLSNPGEPVLPVKTLVLAIPPGTRAVRVDARSLNSIDIAGRFDILPGQPPLRTSESSYQLTVEPDEEVYSSTLPYPGDLVSLDHEGDLAGQEIVWLTVYPLQYIPVEKQLILHDLIEVIVYCEMENTPGNESLEQYYNFTEIQRRSYEDLLRTLVSNPEAVIVDPPVGSPSPVLPSGEYGHVIVTSSSYASGFQPLVDWHTKKGVRDTVVTTGWIYDNYEGPGDTLKIRQFVMDASSNWGTMYFLLGGEHSTVPFVYRNYYGENTPGDQYYSDYDDDWTHEVFVGRASVQSSEQTTTFVDKVLNYEKNPPLTDYPLEVLLIGMDLDGSTHGEELMETVDGYIPSRFTVTKVYDSDSGNHRTAAMNALNAGQNLVNHADHSYMTVMGTGSYHHGWHIYNSDVDALTNDNQASIIVSIGCDPNAMDHNDSISEHFVIYNSGQAGVAFTGNTRSGWYSVGSPEALSGKLDREWWQGVFQYDQNNLGEALAWSKHHFGQAMSLFKHCEWTFNLLGEPLMPLWLDTPAPLEVIHADSIPAGGRRFTVTVEDGGDPVENALVCLMKSGEIYEVGFTDSTGEVNLTISASSQGTMDVTVSARDYIPYEGTCTVTRNFYNVPVQW